MVSHAKLVPRGHASLALSQGAHFSTSDFAVNLNARYAIDIDSENKIPVETLQCLLGSRSPERCNVPAVLRVHWVVSSDGTTTQGSSDETGSYGETGPSGEASRTIGFFTAEKGRTYRVDFDVLADGSRLAVTNPRLKVSVFDTSYKSGLVVTGFLQLGCGVVALFGVLLLVMSGLKHRRVSHPLPADPRADPASGGVSSKGMSIISPLTEGRFSAFELFSQRRGLATNGSFI